MKKIVIILVIIVLYNCSKMNELHQPYLDWGETIYTEKVDSLITFSGKNRIELQWFLFSDVTINKARVFWNDRSDSLDLDIAVTSGVRDEYSVIVNNLEESTYVFEVFTLDSFGNKSIPVTKTGKALGDLYLSNLDNRVISSHTTTATTVDFVMSSNLPDDYVYSEFRYTNLTGVEVTDLLPEDDLDSFSIDLTGIDTSKNIFFRSVYLPNGNAIDEFRTEYMEYVID